MKCKECEENSKCECCGKDIEKHNTQITDSTIRIIAGIPFILMGILFCLTIIGTIIGIPLILIGCWLIRK